MRIRRIIAFFFAGGITFGLFSIMQTLIAVATAPAEDELRSQAIEFVRVKKDSETRRKERRLPKKVEQAKEPPPPNVRMARAPKPNLGAVNANVIALPTGDLAAPSAGAALSDMDVVPLVRIAPEYPARAAERGVAGWVLLEFTVTAAGTVRDVSVVDSDPPRTFDRAAKKAVSRFKYRPKIENGKPVERQGVQIVLRFDPTETDG